MPKCGTITIYSDANVNAKSYSGAGIGSGQYGDSGAVKIYSGATVTASSTSGAGIGSGYQGYCESVTYPSAGITASKVGNGVSSRNDVSVSLSDEEYVFDGYIREIETTETVTSDVTVTSTVTVTETTVETTTQTVDTFTTLTETSIVPTTTTIIETSTGQITSLIVTPSTSINRTYFQWGARSNQSTAILINDMHTKSLRGEIPSKSDLERLNAMDKTSDEYKNFIETLKAASNMTLDDISVGTRENANVAICVINGALDYALDVSTTLGITTMSENVQASESVIRDSDMATAMTNYAKANVLRQAAQSMLALANQNGSNVLTLLQQ